MRVLIIPDVHLKPWMFERTSDLLNENVAEKAVCLMDIADDWNKEFDIALYAESYDAAIGFAKKYPDTLWCYGNHDLSYLWRRRETGYSPMMIDLVNFKINELKRTLPDLNQIAYIHRLDNVLFSHGGLNDYFVRVNISSSIYDDVDEVVKKINEMGPREMWDDVSPIWYRPQMYPGEMYRECDLLQVVGHTPVERPVREKNVISTDVFSTFQGEAIGTEEFTIIDTEDCTFERIR